MTHHALLAILCVHLWACTPKPSPPPATATGEIPVAKLNDRVITDAELMATIRRAQEQFPQKFETHPQKREFLTQMMNIDLLYQAALDAKINERFEFKSRMVDLYVQQIAKEARESITDTILQKIYSENREHIDQISARHILIAKTKAMSPREIREARNKAVALRERALKDPNSFKVLARENSQDGSARNEGELGYFSFGMMVPDFSRAAFELKKIGEISPVIETDFGFHIIQLTGDRRGLEFHREIVVDRVLKDRQREVFESTLKRLKQGVPFEIYEENLAKLSPIPDIVNQDPKKVLEWNVDKSKSPATP